MHVEQVSTCVRVRPDVTRQHGSDEVLEYQKLEVGRLVGLLQRTKKDGCLPAIPSLPCLCEGHLWAWGG